MTDRITLRAMRFEGHHGVSEEERALPQPLEVDLVVEADLERAGRTDEVADTIDYGPLIELCRGVVERNSFRLLESIAAAIADRALDRTTASAVTVRVRKLAVPVNITRPIMDQAAVGLPLTRPWVGLQYQTVTPALVSRLDLPVDYGVLVGQTPESTEPAVVADSPAARAGIQQGDLITAINEERIDVSHTLDDLLAQYRADDMLSLSVLRAGQTMTLRLILDIRPAAT